MNSIRHSSATRIASLWRGYQIRKLRDILDYNCTSWSGYEAMLRVLNEEIARRSDLQRHIAYFVALLRYYERRLEEQDIYNAKQIDWLTATPSAVYCHCRDCSYCHYRPSFW
jgi:hypothetical protein